MITGTNAGGVTLSARPTIAQIQNGDLVTQLSQKQPNIQNGDLEIPQVNALATQLLNK